MLINLINNNPNIENKEEIIKKFINSKNETGKYLLETYTNEVAKEGNFVLLSRN